MLDFTPVRQKQTTIQQVAEGLTRADLAELTAEMVARQLTLIEGVDDAAVTMVPDDPAANDTFAADPADVGLAWTLGHVIVHTTASAEEAAGQALMLARGVPVTERSRVEVPWQEATSAEFVRGRLRESLRMRLAMLEAWPDRPDLENLYVYTPNSAGLNAMARFLGGLSHDDSHLGQIEAIVDQARAKTAAAR